MFQKNQRAICEQEFVKFVLAYLALHINFNVDLGVEYVKNIFGKKHMVLAFPTTFNLKFNLLQHNF